MRDAPIVPETKPLDDLLADLQRQRSSLAIVVDEYGRTAGVVTVEDIVEEVVGEIADETDPAAGAVRRLPNGDWFVRGHVAVTDLEDYGLSLPVDTDAYNSVGGFVFAELGRLPKRGDTIAANGFSIRVESVRENRIEAVRISSARAARTRRGSNARKPHDALPCRDDRRCAGGWKEEGSGGLVGPPRNEAGPLARAGCASGRRCCCEVRRTESMRARHEATLSGP